MELFPLTSLAATRSSAFPSLGKTVTPKKYESATPVSIGNKTTDVKKPVASIGGKTYRSAAEPQTIFGSTAKLVSSGLAEKAAADKAKKEKKEKLAKLDAAIKRAEKDGDASGIRGLISTRKTVEKGEDVDLPLSLLFGTGLERGGTEMIGNFGEWLKQKGVPEDRSVDLVAESFLKPLYSKAGEAMSGFAEGHLAENKDIARPTNLPDIIDGGWKDPRVWAATLGEGAPQIFGSLGAVGATTYATGNPLAGLAAGAAFMYPQETGSAFKDYRQTLLDNGYKEREAEQLASKESVKYGAVSAVLENLLAYKIFGKNPATKAVQRSLISRILGIGVSTVVDVGIEGGTELTQEWAQSTIKESMVTDKSIWLSMIDTIKNPESRKRMIESGLAGGMLGLFGVPVDIIHNASSGSATKNDVSGQIQKSTGVTKNEADILSKIVFENINYIGEQRKAGLKGPEQVPMPEGFEDIPTTPQEPVVPTQDYRIAHQISSLDSKPASDLGNLEEIVSEAKKKNGYLTNYDIADLKKLKKMQGNPDMEVKIYRTSPKNVLNDGDWVTTSKIYAGDIKKQNGGKVYEYTVKAKDLKYPNNLDELPLLARFSAFRYDSQTVKAEPVIKPIRLGVQPKSLAEEARKYKTAEEFIAARIKIGIVDEWGTRNQFSEKTRGNELEDVKLVIQGEKPSAIFSDVKESEIQNWKGVAEKQNLEINFLTDKQDGAIDVIVAKNKNKLSKLDAALTSPLKKGEQYNRRLGLALGYEDIGVRTKSQLTDIWNQANKPESIMGKTGIEATRIARTNNQKQDAEYTEFLRTDPEAQKEIKSLSAKVRSISNEKDQRKFIVENKTILDRKFKPKFIKQKNKLQPLVQAVPETKTTPADDTQKLLTTKEAPYKLGEDFVARDSKKKAKNPLLRTIEETSKGVGQIKEAETGVRGLGSIFAKAEKQAYSKDLPTRITSAGESTVKAASRGYVQGRNDQKSEMTSAFKITKKDLLQTFKDKKTSIEEKQNALIYYIKRNLPASLHGKFLKAVTKLKTENNLKKELTRVNTYIEKNFRKIVLGKLGEFLDPSNSIYVDNKEAIKKKLEILGDKKNLKNISSTHLDILLYEVDKIAEEGKVKRKEIDAKLNEKADTARQVILDDPNVINVDVEEDAPDLINKTIAYRDAISNKKKATKRKLKEGWGWAQSTQRVIEAGDRNNFKGAQYSQILVPVRMARYKADQAKAPLKQKIVDYIEQNDITAEEDRAVQAYGYIQQKNGLEWIAYDNAKKNNPQAFKSGAKLERSYNKLDKKLKDPTLSESKKSRINNEMAQIEKQLEASDENIIPLVEQEKKSITEFANKVVKDPRLMGFYKLSRETFETIYAEVNKIMKTHYNSQLPHLENYWPMYSAFVDNVMGSPEDAISKLHRKININPTSIRARRGQRERSPQLSAKTTVEMYINDMVHFANVQPALIEAKKIITDPDYVEKAGGSMANFLTWWFDTLAHQGRTPMTSVEKKAHVVRSKTGVVVLGGKATTIALQYLAAFQAAGTTAVGPRVFLNFGRIMYDPTSTTPEEEIAANLFKQVGINFEETTEKISGKISDWKSKRNSWQAPLSIKKEDLWRFLWDSSPELRTRSGGELLIADLAGDNVAALKDAPRSVKEFFALSPSERKDVVKQLTLGKLTAGKDKIVELAFWAMTKADAQVAAATWLTAYENSLKEYGKAFDIKKPNSNAAVLAELATQRSQATVDYADLPRLLQNSNKELSRLLVGHLQTYAINTWGIWTTDVPAALRSDVFSGMLLTAMMILQTVFEDLGRKKVNELLSHRTQEDPWWMDLMDNTVGLVPVFSSLYSAIRYDGDFSPFYGELRNIGEDFVKLFTAEGNARKRAAIGATSSAVGLYYGMPTRQPQQLIEDSLFPYLSTVHEKTAFVQSKLGNTEGTEREDKLIDLYKGGYLSETVRKMVKIKKQVTDRDIPDEVWDLAYINDNEKKEDAIVEFLLGLKTVDERKSVLKQMSTAGVFIKVQKRTSLGSKSSKEVFSEIKGKLNSVTDKEEHNRMLNLYKANGVLTSDGKLGGFEKNVTNTTLWESLNRNPEYKELIKR